MGFVFANVESSRSSVLIIICNLQSNRFSGVMFSLLYDIRLFYVYICVCNLFCMSKTLFTR